MTALGSSEDRERGEKLGVDKYLVKSQVTLEDVVATIKKVLQVPASEANEPVVGQDNAASSTPQAQPEPPKQDTPPADGPKG